MAATNVAVETAILLGKEKKSEQTRSQTQARSGGVTDGLVWLIRHGLGTMADMHMEVRRLT